MWESRRIATLWVSTASYRDSFTFYSFPAIQSCVSETVSFLHISLRKNCAFFSYVPCCMPCPSRTPWFDQRNIVWSGPVTNYVAPQCAIFYSQLLRPPAYIQMVLLRLLWSISGLCLLQCERRSCTPVKYNRKIKSSVKNSWNRRVTNCIVNILLPFHWFWTRKTITEWPRWKPYICGI
jgi:hypothetical protein